MSTESELARQRIESLEAELGELRHELHDAHVDDVLFAQGDLFKAIDKREEEIARLKSDISRQEQQEAQQRPDLLLQAEIVLLGDRTEEGRLVRAVAIPWFEIIDQLERDPHFLNRMPWRKLEELIAGAYERAGCSEVVLTARSGDRGRDIIATWNGIGSIRFIDQVKRFSPEHRVTANDIRALLGVLTRDRNVSKGVITTTSAFAPGIYKEVEDFMPYRLELKDGKQLREWLTAIKRCGPLCYGQPFVPLPRSPDAV